MSFFSGVSAAFSQSDEEEDDVEIRQELLIFILG